MQTIIKNFSKKGVAERALTTILLIIMVLVFVALTYAFYNRLAGTPNLAPKFSCAEMLINPVIEVKRVCFNKEENLVEVKIKNNLEQEITEEINFIISGEADTESWCCCKGCKTCFLPKANEQKTYFLKQDNIQNKNIKILISNCLIYSGIIDDC